MNSFVYIAHDLSGEEKRGQRRGASELEVHAWLHKHGLIPVEVKPVSSTLAVKRRAFGYRQPKHSEMASFCWQLSTMLEGGVLITEGIETIAEDIGNPSFRHALLNISELIKKGESFSSSISQFPRVFSKLFSATIVAGETSGSLTTILQRLAEYYSSRDKFAKKIQTALAYPVFVVSFVVIVLTVMVVLIIPKFRDIFSEMGNKLPAFTRAFMGFYNMMAAHSTYIIISLVSLVVLFIIYNKTWEGHMRLCKLALGVPLVGKVMSQAFVATFCNGDALGRRCFNHRGIRYSF